MAPIPTYWRTWCKTCQEWTLHHQPHRFESVAEKIKFESHCKVCDTVFTEAKFAEIPEEKIMEQRARYCAMKKESKFPMMDKYIGGILSGRQDNSFSTSMEDAYAPRIIEEDAGQKAIDDAEYAVRLGISREQEAARQKLREEAQKFEVLERNDKCACGSGKKYKACCMKKYQPNR